MMLSYFSRIILLVAALVSFPLATSLVAQPANDNLCDAIAVDLNADCGMTFNVNNIDATAELNEPNLSCAGFMVSPTVTNSVWYSFVAPAGEVRILTIPDLPGRNTLLFQMQVFTLAGDCADLSNLVPVACDLPTNGIINSANIITTLTEGETYYVQISGTFYPTDPDLGTYEAEGCLTVTEVVAPVNDAACDAIGLDLNADYQAYSNVGATLEDGEFFIAPPPGDFLGTTNAGWATGANFLDHTVWFTFTTPDSDVGKVTVDLAETFALGGNFNTQVAIYTAGDCADLSTFSFVAGNDNTFFESGDLGGFITASSRMDVFCLEPATTYYLVVDGAPNFFFTNPTPNQGDFLLRVLEEDTQPLEAASLITNPTCPADTTGTIIVNGRFGAESYTYEWSDGFAAADRVRNLSPGDYTVTITDICGEMITETYTVGTSAYGPPIVTGDAITLCEGESITLSANASGGVPLQSDRLYTIDFFGLFAQRNILAPSELDTLAADIGFTLFDIEFAGDELYGVSEGNVFYQIDATNGDTTRISDTLQMGQVRILSYVASTQTLYAFDDSLDLYTIDPGSGAASFVETLFVPLVNGFAIDNNQRVFFTRAGADTLYAYQLGSPSIRDTIGSFPTTFGTYAGLKIDHRTNDLYTAGTSSFQLGAPNWQFYGRVNKTDASVSRFNDYLFTGSTRIFAFFPGTSDPMPDYDYVWTPQDAVDMPFEPMTTLTASESVDLQLQVTDACSETGTATYAITVNPNETTTVDVAISDDSTFIFNGSEINVDTVLVDSLQTAAGCDSIVTINVSIISSTQERRWVVMGSDLSPNPTTGLLNVVIHANREEAMQLEVIDLNGRLLRHYSFKGQQIQLNVGDLPNGTYVLRIQSPTGFTTRRFVKI